MTRRFSLRQFTLLDGLAALAALMALAGAVWSPKLANGLARATGSMESVELSVDVRHLYLDQPETFFAAVREEGTVSIVIRNQPAGRVQLLAVDDITLPLLDLLPDGTIVEASDPTAGRPIHARFQLQAEAETSSSGVVVAGTKLKIGTPVELEGLLYRVSGVVSGLELP